MKTYLTSYGDIEVHDGGIKNGVRMIAGSVTSANIIGFEAGTTGRCGGDSGHGGRTFFRIFNEGGSDIRVTTNDCGEELSVELGGDCELDTIIEALRAITLILEDGARNGTRFTREEKIVARLDGYNEMSIELRKVDALESIAESLRFSPRMRRRD